MIINHFFQVNKNILLTSNLDVIPTNLEGEEGYVEPPYVLRIDSRIPGMNPIYCIEKGYVEEDIVCVLQLGKMYVVPVYNHFGNLNENIICDWWVFYFYNVIADV